MGPAAPACQPHGRWPRRALPASMHGAVPGRGDPSASRSAALSAEAHAHTHTNTKRRVISFLLGLVGFFFVASGFSQPYAANIVFLLMAGAAGSAVRAAWASGPSHRHGVAHKHRAMGLLPPCLPGQPGQPPGPGAEGHWWQRRGLPPGVALPPAVPEMAGLRSLHQADSPVGDPPTDPPMYFMGHLTKSIKPQ